MADKNEDKKLTRTVAVVLNKDLLNQVKDIGNKEYEGSTSFSFVVRKLIEKGIKQTVKEREHQTEILRVYEASKEK